MVIKGKLRREYKQFRKDATWLEAAFWIIGWTLMLYGTITLIRKHGDPNTIMILEADTSAALVIPFLHLLPRRIFLARISYRAIDWVLCLALGAGFIGKFLDIYKIIPSYDSYLHVVGCFFLIFAGYEVAKAMTHSPETLTPIVAAVCGFGLSFFSAVAWEIFEFICDEFFNGNVQNWAFAPSQEFLQKFPMVPQRWPIFDTMFDLICGTLGSIIGGFVLFLFLAIKSRKRKSHGSRNENNNKKVAVSLK